MLSQGNVVAETIFEAKQIIFSLGLEVKKSTRARMVAFYIVGLSIKSLRNALFVDSTDSIVEKTFLLFLI
jgi:hypothetical protein